MGAGKMAASWSGRSSDGKKGTCNVEREKERETEKNIINKYNNWAKMNEMK